MYTMQSIIRRGMNNALTQFERLGHVSNNLANYTTTGYKTVSFEQMLNEDGYLTGAIRTDYKNGSIKVTSNPYDVALTDKGFIPVVSPEGEVAYTRDGAFKQGKEGYLVTSDDWMVGDGIKIPANCHKFTIKPNGEVLVYDAIDKPARKIGTIPLVTFDCPEGLKQSGMNKLVPTDESGDAILVKNPDCFAQNNIEVSNTNIFNSMTDILRINASMLASTKMLKVVDDMYNKAINIREG